MEQIILNDKNFIDKVETISLVFEINPLDVNLAQIQLNFINKIENSNEKNVELSASYISENPLLNVSEIKIFTEEESFGKSLKLTLLNKSQTRIYIYNIITGTQENLINFIRSKDFIRISKNVIKDIT